MTEFAPIAVGPSTPENKFRYAMAVRDGSVVRVEFDNLRKGDQFRLYEWNGAAVDEFICTAASDAVDGFIAINAREKR